MYANQNISQIQCRNLKKTSRIPEIKTVRVKRGEIRDVTCNKRDRDGKRCREVISRVIGARLNKVSKKFKSTKRPKQKK